jgi:hypothetical protein
VTWSISSDVHEFVAATGDFLAATPVDNTVLLTEAAYLAAQPSSELRQLYGWWQPAGGAVAGAFLQAPHHPPVLSMMSSDLAESCLGLFTDLPAVGVDGRLADSVITAWRNRTGASLFERSRIRLYRLGELQAPQPPPGQARVATAADRELLVAWFDQLMSAFPDDPSELAYVVDDPISHGGIVLWEVDGITKAMAGRSRLVAGMVRLSAVYSPDDDAHARAAFVAACLAAQEVARDVLVFAQASDPASDTAYQQLGFEPVLERVMLSGR